MSEKTEDQPAGREGETLQEQEPRTREIVRTSSFVRLAADSVIFFPLGHDSELSFMVSGPRPVERIAKLDENGEEEGESFKLSPVIEEVARVRLPPAVASTLAMNILARQAKEDVFYKELLKEQFDEILSMIPDQDQLED